LTRFNQTLCKQASLIRHFSQHDVTIIGGGPGGYVAAIKAAQ